MSLVPVSAPTSCRISGKDIREFGIELSAIPDIFMPPVRTRRQEIPGRAGSRDLGGFYDNWSFTIEAEIRGATHNDVVTKIDAFTEWVDLTQHYSAEFMIARHAVEGLLFELCGHLYDYTDGTVAVTNGSKVITGTGTLWLKQLTEDSVFIVDGDSTRYIIGQIPSNTELVLTSAITRANGSSLSYQAERKRFLLVNYNGESSIAAAEGPAFGGGIFTISLGFTTTYPFWVGPLLTHIESSPAAGTFIDLKGVGNTPFSNILFHVFGEATNPKIGAVEYSFVSNFNGVMTVVNIENREQNPSASSITGYRATRTGLGILFGGSFTLETEDKLTLSDVAEATVI